MIFHPLDLQGAYRISLERRLDERGFFARSYCSDEFSAMGLVTDWVQSNISYNKLKGTLRGLHYQVAPHAEAKLVRCLHGAIFDVLVDLRAGSPSFGRWTALTLSDDNRDTAYLPAGFAHGFQTLTDDAEVQYFHSQRYVPVADRGVSHADPVLAIAWPLLPVNVSARDLAFPNLSAIEPVQT